MTFDLEQLWRLQYSIEQFIEYAEYDWGISDVELAQAKGIVVRCRKDLEQARRDSEQAAKKYQELAKSFEKGYTHISPGQAMNLVTYKSDAACLQKKVERLARDLDKALKLVKALAEKRGEYSAFRKYLVDFQHSQY